MSTAHRNNGPPREARSPLRLYVLIGLAAALFGALILPRLGARLEGGFAPDFALPVLSGGEPGARVRLSEQRGRPVLLDFWASWCGPCKAQTKVLEAFVNSAAGKGFVVLGVNVNDDPAAAQRYLASVRPSWIVVGDSEGTIGSAYQVQQLPTLVLIDRAGRIFTIRRHFMSEGELSALVAGMGSQ